MAKNEWGVTPGSQDNITPVEAPMLSELECDLINLFRAFPEKQQRAISGMLLSATLHGLKLPE